MLLIGEASKCVGIAHIDIDIDIASSKLVQCNVPIRNMSLKIKKFTLLLREKFSASYVGSWLNAINFKINRIHHLNFAKNSFLMAQGAQSYHFVGPSHTALNEINALKRRNVLD